MELEEAMQWLNDFTNLIAINGRYTIIEERLTEFQKAIETVLQALEDLQQKERSRIIGNIYGIKVEDLEPILKPYYIPKKKIEDKIKTHQRINKERGYLLVRESFAKKELQELLEDK